jgi:hypothetical protein
MRRLTGRGLRLRGRHVRRLTRRRLRLRGRHVRRLTRRRLRRGGRRRARVRLLLRSGLRGGGHRSARRRCVGGRRMLLARRSGLRRALRWALAGGPLVVCLGRSALCKANPVVDGLRKSRLRARGDKKHCGTKQKGITCHWIPRLWVIAPRFDSEPRSSVQVDDSAPPRDLMRQPVRLETTTTRQNCGENPRSRYLRTSHGRFVPGVPIFSIGAHYSTVRSGQSSKICADRIFYSALAGIGEERRRQFHRNARQVLRSTSSFLICAMA